jgi:hypothetical protein
LSTFENYINLDESIPSRSRLYADSLPGIDSEMIEGLAKGEKTSDDTWEVLYKRACDSLVTDVGRILNGKFSVDLKLVTRETSEFKDTLNLSGGLAGVQISFQLPKYARIHIISIDVFSEETYDSPDVPFYVYDTNEGGELLLETTGEIIEGRNTVFIDRDFEKETLFVAYDSDHSFRGTQNKKYATSYLYWGCDECRFDCGGYEGKVAQVNSGGLNVKYNVYCSVEKFVCENINLLAQTLLWKIGQVISEERRFGERLNRFTTMTLERWEELIGFYTEKYKADLAEVIKSMRIPEDVYCFPCSKSVGRKSQTP